MFSCEFCEILKTIFFTEHLWATAAAYVFESLIHKNILRKLFSRGFERERW